jgi:LCP family protein required for cell wall assembly
MGDWPGKWYRDDDGQQGSSQGAGRPGEAAPTAARGGQSGWPEQPEQPGRSGWPEQPGRSGTGGGPGQRPGGRRRFWGQPGRHGRRIALIAGTVVVLLVVALAGSYFWLDSKLNRTVVLPAFTGQSAGQNWLIAGSDTRSGLTDEQIKSLHVGFDFGTSNSDSLLLLHMGTGRPVLISIPRDSYVPIPGHGENKINAALGFGGPSLLVQTIENVTGLHINHYMGIGFGGLVSVVDKVGGVTICLPKALHDEDSGVNLKAGCQVLDGAQSLEFVRDRHSFADEDLQREQDQRVFLKALLDKATTPGVYLNPLVALPFGSTAASSISVDQGTHLYDLVQAALALRNPQTGTVPIANANYETPNAGDAVQWNQAEALELFNALKNGQAIPQGLLGGTTVG